MTFAHQILKTSDKQQNASLKQLLVAHTVGLFRCHFELNEIPHAYIESGFGEEVLIYPVKSSCLVLCIFFDLFLLLGYHGFYNRKVLKFEHFSDIASI